MGSAPNIWGSEECLSLHSNLHTSTFSIKKFLMKLGHWHRGEWLYVAWRSTGLHFVSCDRRPASGPGPTSSFLPLWEYSFRPLEWKSFFKTSNLQNWLLIHFLCAHLFLFYFICLSFKSQNLFLFKNTEETFKRPKGLKMSRFNIKSYWGGVCAFLHY